MRYHEDEAFSTFNLKEKKVKFLNFISLWLCCIGVGFGLNRTFMGFDSAFKFFVLPNHFDFSIHSYCPTPSTAGNLGNKMLVFIMQYSCYSIWGLLML